VKTVVYIDAELFQKVMEIAPRVYNVARGALSLAVEEALRYWVQMRSTHNAHKPVNPRPDHREVFNCTIRCIEETLGFLPITVNQSLMENCILQCRGAVDPRTAYKWLHSFYLNGWIKPLTITPRKPSDWSRNKAVELVAKEA